MELTRFQPPCPPFLDGNSQQNVNSPHLELRLSNKRTQEEDWKTKRHLERAHLGPTRSLQTRVCVS